MRWLIILLSMIAAGWLAFDGVHALVTGDYVTPASGPHAGRLGPWSNIFAAVGVDPRSAAVMWLHVLVGGAWLGAVVAFAFRLRRSWWAMLICAAAGLWYLPFGTMISFTVMGLLLSPAVRSRHSGGT